MSKKKSKRFASAQERLRRIEKTIGPYLDKGPADARRPQGGRWVPSDSVQVTGKTKGSSRQDRKIAAISN
jgi:hypothetical protein